MAKQKAAEFDLEETAKTLDTLASQAEAAGEERTMKAIQNASRSARASLKQRAVRRERAGKLIETLQARGLSAEQIIAELTR